MSNGIQMIFLVVALVGVLYFLMIRPARRQQQQLQQMMSSLAVGSRVMLTSGIYGTIRHLGDSQAIIEISPGVDLTVMRRAISKVVSSEEEEFEYADAVAPDDSTDQPDGDGPAVGSEGLSRSPASPTPTSGTGWSLADLPTDDPARAEAEDGAKDAGTDTSTTSKP